MAYGAIKNPHQALAAAKADLAKKQAQKDNLLKDFRLAAEAICQPTNRQTPKPQPAPAPTMSWHEQHRACLGIPENLRDKPVIYFSAHARLLPNWKPDTEEEMIIDVSSIESAAAVMAVLDAKVRKYMEPNTPYIVNIQTIHPLDQAGNAKGSCSFGIDRTNADYIWGKAKEHMIGPDGFLTTSSSKSDQLMLASYDSAQASPLIEQTNPLEMPAGPLNRMLSQTRGFFRRFGF